MKQTEFVISKETIIGGGTSAIDPSMGGIGRLVIAAGSGAKGGIDQQQEKTSEDIKSR